MEFNISYWASLSYFPITYSYKKPKIENFYVIIMGTNCSFQQSNWIMIPIEQIFLGCFVFEQLYF